MVLAGPSVCSQSLWHCVFTPGHNSEPAGESKAVEGVDTTSPLPWIRIRLAEHSTTVRRSQRNGEVSRKRGTTPRVLERQDYVEADVNTRS